MRRQHGGRAGASGPGRGLAGRRAAAPQVRGVPGGGGRGALALPVPAAVTAVCCVQGRRRWPGREVPVPGERRGGAAQAAPDGLFPIPEGAARGFPAEEPG